MEVQGVPCQLATVASGMAPGGVALGDRLPPFKKLDQTTAPVLASGGLLCALGPPWAGYARAVLAGPLVGALLPARPGARLFSVHCLAFQRHAIPISFAGSLADEQLVHQVAPFSGLR